jgi:hypothetical protein
MTQCYHSNFGNERARGIGDIQRVCNAPLNWPPVNWTFTQSDLELLDILRTRNCADTAMIT